MANHSGAVPSGVRLICSSSETGAEANPSEMDGYLDDLVGILHVRGGPGQRVGEPERRESKDRTRRPSSHGGAATTGEFQPDELLH